MEFSVKHTDKITTLKSDCLLVGIHTDGSLTTTLEAIDGALNGLITDLIKHGDFKGKAGDSLCLMRPAGLACKRLILLGMGKSDDELSHKDAEKIIEAGFQSANKTGSKSAHWLIDNDATWFYQKLAQLGEQQSYRYVETKSEPTPAANLTKLTLISPSRANTALKQAVVRGHAIGCGANVARELGNLPGNICTPQYLAKQAQQLAKKHSEFNCKILSEKQMASLGMNSLLSVGHGSDQESRLITLEYRGAGKKQAPIALVGKGITFDSGGISLKGGAGMDEMKFDMCGAASVLGVMHTLALLKPAINVVCVVAAAENMPSGRATKPGDVVKSMSGQTIEILNTDAEGRLVLCDALTYAGRYEPDTVIDVATLTGACIVALGKVATGLYANDQTLADELLAAGQACNDRAWQMPLWDDYQSLLDSNFADIANIGGPHGGSITAACFLSRFAKDYRWAHLDIAGTAWHSAGKQKGATGRPVPMLSEFILSKVPA